MKLMHWLPLAALSLLLVACDSGSPQKTFDAAKLAIEKKDHKAFAACLTPDSQAKLNFGMTFVASFATMGKNFKPDPAKEKELDAILDKHGMKDAMNKEKKKQSMEQVQDEFKKVKDPAGMYAELMAFAEKHAKKKDGDKTGPTVADFHELKNVKVEGDSATGTLVVKKKDGKLDEREIAFKKIDGKWLIEIVEQKKKKKAPEPEKK